MGIVQEAIFQSLPLSLCHNAGTDQDHTSDARDKSLSSFSFLSFQVQFPEPRLKSPEIISVARREQSVMTDPNETTGKDMLAEPA